MKVHSYVISTDRGSAPNYDAPATTLAICKPRIRKRANDGELVIAFNGYKLSRERNSVRWAGMISEVLTFREYWHDPRFVTKKPDQSATPDNIYCDDGAGLFQVENSSHNSENVDTDLRGINVLVFSEVWHLGSSHESLGKRFSRLFVGGKRRHEPLNDISVDEWDALRTWLDARGNFDPSGPERSGRHCRPASTGRKPIARERKNRPC